jgi:alcohol oxidase
MCYETSRKSGVVDRFLRLYEPESQNCWLIIAVSFCPSMSGNTYSTALIVGEKAAMIITSELGMNGI